MDKASEKLGQEIRRTVITVPAYFNDAQRRATIRAGELAGLEVSRIINEPTAASLVYDHVTSLGRGPSPYILVYDLGGGTFDVSILEIKGEIKEVLASCGDTALGGDDFDERLVAFFLRKMKEETGIDFSNHDRALHVRLSEIAEKAKISLSDQPFVWVKEVGLTHMNGEPIHLNLEIDRKDYEEMIGDLVQKTVKKVEEALDEARLNLDDISNVILVGGATKTPLSRKRSQGCLNAPFITPLIPISAWRWGPLFKAGSSQESLWATFFLDVTAHSLRVKTADAVDDESGGAHDF